MSAGKKHSLPRSQERTHPVMGSVGSSRREETNAFSLSALKALVKLAREVISFSTVLDSKVHVTL